MDCRVADYLELCLRYPRRVIRMAVKLATAYRHLGARVVLMEMIDLSEGAFWVPVVQVNFVFTSSWVQRFLPQIPCRLHSWVLCYWRLVDR